jgi:hypothetical protein
VVWVISLFRGALFGGLLADRQLRCASFPSYFPISIFSILQASNLVEVKLRTVPHRFLLHATRFMLSIMVSPWAKLSTPRRGSAIAQSNERNSCDMLV